MNTQPSLRMLDIPAEERPRERLLDLGSDGLSSVDLLAVLIGTGTRGRSALDLARDLLARAGSLPALARLDPGELTQLPGLGPSRAARLSAALELGRRAMLPTDGRARIERPEDAAALLLPHYHGRDREHFGVLLLDARRGVLGRRTIAIGSLNQSLVHPREVFRPAIVLRAAAVVLFHNHPSGDPTPSSEDLVLGDGRFSSVREGGQVRFPG